MRIALAQINAKLGAFSSNRAVIESYISKAVEQNADLVVFPEAALFGYHPVDLLERSTFVDEQMRELKNLHKGLPKDIAVVVGAITPNFSGKGKPYWNCAVWLEKSKKIRYFPKQLLPTYDVFDEGRHIQPGKTSENRLKFKGYNILVTICEDIWAWPRKDSPGFASYEENPLMKIPKSKVDFVVNLSASPFTQNKRSERFFVTKKVATHFRAPMVYVNMMGAQDELIFDGASFALDAKGKVIAQCERFQEDLVVFDLEAKKFTPKKINEEPIAVLKEALVLGLRDYVFKTGFKKVHLGLSGGIDSALVACLAAEALDPANVRLIAMPGPFSAPESLKWAEKLAKNLGCPFDVAPIVDGYHSTLKSLDAVWGAQSFGVMHENLQARLRGMILMAFANRENSLLLSTSNKSEMAVGYSTLYGDMCGAIAPIGDVLKEEVFALSEFYNREREVIPRGIITRPPSAELRPNQKDQDSLPPYEELDAIVRKLVERFEAPSNDTEKWVLNALMKSEFKRWQAPPILKVSTHAFGRGRRLPVAHS